MIQEQSIFSILTKILLVWRNEIENDDIVALDENFLREILNIMKKINSFKPTNNIEEEIVEMLSSILSFIYSDISSLRIIKALFKKLYYGTISKNLWINERVLLETIDSTIKTLETTNILSRGILESYLIEYTPLQFETKRTLCIFYRDANKFVGDDSLIYRGARQGSILHLPTKNFEIFVYKQAKISKIEIID